MSCGLTLGPVERGNQVDNLRVVRLDKSFDWARASKAAPPSKRHRTISNVVKLFKTLVSGLKSTLTILVVKGLKSTDNVRSWERWGEVARVVTRSRSHLNDLWLKMNKLSSWKGGGAVKVVVMMVVTVVVVMTVVVMVPVAVGVVVVAVDVDVDAFAVVVVVGAGVVVGAVVVANAVAAAAGSPVSDDFGGEKPSTVAASNLMPQISKTLRLGNWAVVAIVGMERLGLLERLRVWRLGNWCGASNNGSRLLMLVLSRFNVTKLAKMGWDKVSRHA